MSKLYKPVGITTAGPGWLAVFEVDDRYEHSPVAAWVLKETESGGFLVHGIGGEAMASHEQTSNFYEYIFCPECFRDGLCDKHRWVD